VPVPRHDPIEVLGPILLGGVVLALLAEPLAALPLLAAFAYAERRARVSVIPRHPSGRAVAAISFATGVAFLGAEGYITLDLQAGTAWSVLAASSPLIGATLMWTLGTLLAARIDATLRATIAWGAAIVGVGTLVMALPGSGGTAAALGYTLAGLGMGLESPALFGAVLSDELGAEGRESAVVPVTRTIGGGVGVALIGALLVHRLPAATLDAAEHGVAPLASLHEAARLGYLLLALVALGSLPAARWLRVARRGS
jgi:hypothetical protein